jgi:hypothetical protein
LKISFQKSIYFKIFQKILHFPLQFFSVNLFLKNWHFKEYVICAKAAKALGEHLCFVTLKDKLLKQTQLDEKSSK